MKISAFLLIAVVIGIIPLSATDLQNRFIQRPGQYVLDGKGSALTIRKEADGEWTLKVLWVTGEGESVGSNPEDGLRAEGWFVFVEKPGLIWVFDGIDRGALLSHGEKETGVTALYFAQRSKPVCPEKFWEALPEKLRARHVSAANGE